MAAQRERFSGAPRPDDRRPSAPRHRRPPDGCWKCWRDAAPDRFKDYVYIDVRHSGRGSARGRCPIITELAHLPKGSGHRAGAGLPDVPLPDGRHRPQSLAGAAGQHQRCPGPVCGRECVSAWRQLAGHQLLLDINVPIAGPASPPPVMRRVTTCTTCRPTRKAMVVGCQRHPNRNTENERVADIRGALQHDGQQRRGVPHRGRLLKQVLTDIIHALKERYPGITVHDKGETLQHRPAGSCQSWDY